VRRLNLLFAKRGGNEHLATFIERPGGSWDIQIEEGQDSRLVGTLISKVSLYRLERKVDTSEGDLYFEALQETFGRSSRYILVEEEQLGTNLKT